jgi:hypothetical protein
MKPSVNNATAKTTNDIFWTPIIRKLLRSESPTADTRPTPISTCIISVELNQNPGLLAGAAQPYR